MTSDRCLLITLLISLSSIPLLADDTDEVLDSFDKEIDRARKAYERALKKSSEKAIQKLEGIANRALRKKIREKERERRLQGLTKRSCD